MPETTTEHPLMSLDQEDLDLIMALVLEGSSLKGLASRMGVSYPTIRSRLDRVIRRLQQALQGRRPDPLRELMADLVDRGQLNGNLARRILAVADERRQPDGHEDRGIT